MVSGFSLSNHHCRFAARGSEMISQAAGQVAVVDDGRCLDAAGVGAEATERVGVQEGEAEAAPVGAIASAGS